MHFCYSKAIQEISKLSKVSIFLLALTGSACQSLDPNSFDEHPGYVGDLEVVPDEIDEVLTSQALNPKPNMIPPIGAEEDEINKVIKEGIPVEVNEEVEKWIHFFTVKRPDLMQRYLERGERYKPMIVSLLRDHGVPTELYYLALIESGFTKTARSHAGAVGIWQFIRGTGRRYGLRIDHYVDERIDLHRSTIAATIYLNDLHNIFDSWYLAMAAYNAGEMRIMRAIMNGKTRDFWELARQRKLPRETMNYIPKFLAAVIIGSQPEKYGFRLNPQPAMQSIAPINVAAPVKLSDIANASGVSYGTLRELNPHLLKKMTPPGMKQYQIWVPEDEKHAVTAISNDLSKYLVNVRSTPEYRGTRRYHRVRRGETLSSISRKYGMTIRELKKLNRLRSNRIYAGTRIRIAGSSQAQATKYRVRRGDNLYAIAKRFGMTVRELKRLNRLSRNTIYAGQVLRVASRG